MTKRRLGELLQAEGLVNEDQVRAALEEQRKSNLFLGEALVKLGFVTEEVIAQTIVQQFNLPFASALQFQILPEVLNIFPERMYYEYQFMAVDKMSKVLVIVGAGLMNHDVLDELERCSGCKVHQFVSTWKDIRTALEKHAKDFKKEQSELTSLGTMLLDMTPAPGAVLAPAGANGHAPAQPPAPPKPAAPGGAGAGFLKATKSGAAAAVQTPGGNAAAPVVGVKPAGATASASGGASRSGMGAAVPGMPKPAMASAMGAPAARSGLSSAVPDLRPQITPALGTKPPSAISGMHAQVPGAPARPQSQKLSALSGFKPAGTAPDGQPGAAKQDTPTGVQVVKPNEAGKAPGAPKSGTGLLGLFKKP